MKLMGQQLVEMTTPQPDTGKSAIQEIIAADLPVKVSLQVARLAKDLMDEATLLDHERVKLVRKFGTVDPGTGNTSVPEDRFMEFRVEWQTVLDSQVEIRHAYVNISDKDMGAVKLSPRTIILLDPAITFGEPEKPSGPAVPCGGSGS